MPPGFVLKYNEHEVFGYINDLDDFIEKVDLIPDEVLSFHINKYKNDFLQWIKDVFHLYIDIDDNLPPREAIEEIALNVEDILVHKRKEILNSFPIEPDTLEEKILNPPKEKPSLFKKFINLLRERV